MTPRKKRRLITLVVAMVGLAVAALAVLTALKSELVFFYSPTDLTRITATGRAVRLGGLVEKGSLLRQNEGLSIAFTVTDTVTSVPVVYSGVVPDLFSEERGVVAEGKLGADGIFHATTLMAKHDERYMPPEVAKALAKAHTDAGISSRVLTP